MYLLLIDDLDKLEEMRPSIVGAAEAVFSSKPLVFEEFRFVSATGYGQRTIDEVELVLGSQSQGADRLKERVEQFIEQWGFEAFRDEAVLSLSSGWQKYLSLALFSELLISHGSAVLFMPFHYLDRQRTVLALKRLSVQPKTLIVDLDAARLQDCLANFQPMVLKGGILEKAPLDAKAGPNANF
jgi:hypothetical protein